MNLIGKNEVLFEELKSFRVRILDSKISKILIYTQNVEDLIIEIDFDQRMFEGYAFKLKFSGIKEFFFYHTDTSTFRIVENYTLLRAGDLYYLSVDPEDDRSAVISENDQDFILCNEIEGYFI
jgi:hypothetical protein